MGLADGTLQIESGSGIASRGVAWEQAETLPKITAPPVLFLDAVGGSVWTLRIGSGSGSGSGVTILRVAQDQAETLPKRTTPLVLFLDRVGGSVWTLSKINAPLVLFLDAVGGSVWTLLI